MPQPLHISLPARFADDASAMQHALELARLAVGLSEPNPRVGCVIVDAQGRALAHGHTQAAGEAHAEVMALRDAQARKVNVVGATAYVTLEPCSHHGRTPPCCDALIEARVKRVVVACQDPNPLVAGQGIARLQDAGISVDLGLLAEPARDLNIGFFSRMQRGQPWLRMKVAASLDGRTALPNGVSQWITCEAARADGHAWRKRAGAVLTGVGTVLEDNPRMDVRLVQTTRQPLRVIVDSRLETPPSSRILDAPGQVLIYAAQANEERAADLRARGVQIVYKPDANGKVDLRAMLQDLGQRGINELHVEAGHKLNGSLVREGLVDELLLYLAPKLMGVGRELAAFGPLTAMDQVPLWVWHSIDRVGDDLRILARPARA